MPETRNRQYGALLRAVEESIRDFLGDTAPDGSTPGKLCGITPPPGRPPSWAGNVWYSVIHRGMVGDSRNPQYVERTLGVAVVLTVRANAKPKDRLGNALVLEIDNGIADRVDALADYIHGNYDLMHRANALMRSEQVAGVDVEQGFEEPLLFQSATDPQEQGPLWFGADPMKLADMGGSSPPAGYSVTLNWGGAKFIKDKRVLS